MSDPMTAPDAPLPDLPEIRSMLWRIVDAQMEVTRKEASPIGANTWVDIRNTRIDTAIREIAKYGARARAEGIEAVARRLDQVAKDRYAIGDDVTGPTYEASAIEARALAALPASSEGA